MTDADILAVLRSIDKSLKAASNTTKERPSLTRQIAGGASSPDKRDAAEASKAIRATASSARKLSTATQGLTKSFDGLNVEVRRTITNFGSLGTQLSKLISSLDVQQVKQQPALNFDSKEFASFKMELNESIGTFGMLNTRIGKLVQRISSLTPDRDKLTKALIDVTTKAMQPMQTFGKQLGQAASQLNLFNAALAKSIDQIGKVSGSFVIDPETVKAADDFGSKLGELASITIDTNWAKELSDLIGTKLSPRLVELGDTAHKLQQELSKINFKDMDKDDVNSRELNKSIKNAIMIARQFNKSSSAVAANFKTVGDSVLKLGKQVDQAGLSVTKFIDALNAKVQSGSDAPTKQGILAGLMGTLGAMFAKAPKTETPATPAAPAGTPPNIPLAPLADAAGGARKGLLGVATGALRSGVGLMIFEKTVSAAWHVVTELTNSFFKLASVGMGSTDSLFSIGKAAFKAGMSIEEYTKVLADNSELASRAGSIDQFDKLISAADTQLKQLGVFGADARALQASLANSATLAGVPQAQLAEAVKGQIDTFDRLRKSVNMTSTEFAELVSNVTNNVQSQKELVGLAPAERAARQSELVQIAATGRSLGLSAEASKRLTDALIAQRGETVKKRFESAGRVRQLAAMTGDAGAGEEAAQIIMKGRRASADELKRLREIAGTLDQSAQSLYETGNFGQQAALDTIDEALSGSAFKNVMEANRPAQLASDSAAVYNKDFGKHVDEFGQAVGSLRTMLVGVSKSVFAPLIGAVAGLAGGAFAKIIGGNILSAFKSGGAAGGAGGAGAAAEATAVSTRLANAAKAAVGALGRIGNATYGFLNTLVSAPINAVKTAGSWIGRLFGMLSGFSWKAFDSMALGIARVQVAIQEAGGVLPKLGQILGSAWGSIVSGFQGVTSVIGRVSGAISGAFSGVAGAAGEATSVMSRIGSALSGAWSSFTGFFKGIPGMASNLFKAIPTQVVSSFGAAFETIGPLLKGAMKFAAWIGPLIDGVSEAFTGALSTTFSEGGGVIDRIFGVALAAFRAIPAGILGAVDKVFGTNFTNGLDIVLTTMVLGIQTIKQKFFDGLYAVVSSIPFLKNTAFANTLKGWKEQQAADVDKTAATLDSLIDNSGKTLDTIGKKNKEEAEAREKSTQDATVKVAETDKKFADKFNSTAVGMVTRAGLVSDAKILAGMPAQQQVSTVTPAANPTNTVTPPTTQTQQANLNTADKSAGTDKTTQAAQSTVDTSAQLMEMIKILQASLAVQQRQVEIGEQQLGSLNTKPATSFIPADYVNYHLLNS